jgi:hypothetical protein
MASMLRLRRHGPPLSPADFIALLGWLAIETRVFGSMRYRESIWWIEIISRTDINNY